MGKSSDKILAVPTNIISGFLGVGKTSAILSLLKNKPAEQRWAVLVNEFGEIGIDGGLFQGQHSETSGVYVTEVPGGCMCCAAGLPMQIALNQLLARAKPHRLLIEPTGLGHPKEVLEVLSAPHYQEVLNIQKNITLVDARKLADPRYTEHDTFNQQIEVADLVVANKQALYQGNEKAQLTKYLAKLKHQPFSTIFTDYGVLDPSSLEGQSSTTVAIQQAKHHHRHRNDVSMKEADLPPCGYVKVENSGEGYKSVGWRFAADNIFSRDQLRKWFQGLKAERMKAVIISEQGIFGYNFVDNTLTEVELDDCIESRIEIITQQVNSDWESQLMACRHTN